MDRTESWQTDNLRRRVLCREQLAAWRELRRTGARWDEYAPAHKRRADISLWRALTKQ